MVSWSSPSPTIDSAPITAGEACVSWMSERYAAVTGSRRTGSATAPPPRTRGNEHRAAGAHEPQAVLDVLDHALGVGVDEDDVVGRLVHARQHLGCPTGDEPRAGRRDLRASANACRAAPRCSGSLSIVVSVARGDPCSSQRPGDAGARADLDDVQRLRCGGDDRALRADRRADRRRAELESVSARPRDVLRLDRRLVRRSGGSRPARPSVHPPRSAYAGGRRRSRPGAAVT